VDCFVSRAGVLVGCVPRYRLKVKDGKSMVAVTADRPRLRAAVEALLARLAYRGACNVQVFEEPDGRVQFVEVNPRLAAGGLPLATEAGVNIPELMLREADGEVLGPVATEAGVRMIRYLSEVFVRG
jgi:carbamoyl-phosphate synthase large subunit